MTANETPTKPAMSRDALVVAVFRVVFTTTIMLTLVDLVPYFREYFADEGFMPRASYLTDHARLHRFALMDAFGRPWQIALYFVATYAALFALLVGFHTRLAAIASFFLVVGMQERNHFVFDGSDNVVRLVLFWMMFADVGRALSLDARRAEANGAEKAPDHVDYVPVRMIELQLALVYVGAVIFKLLGPLWLSGMAARNGLANPHAFSRAWALPLADLPWFVHAATYGAIALEGIAALSMIAPKRLRLLKRIGLLCGVVFHASSWVMMNVGGFPMVMISSYVLFLERADVARFAAWFDRAVLGRVEPGLAALRSATRRELVGRVRLGRDVALVTVFSLAAWISLPHEQVRFVPAMPAPLKAFVQSISVWQQWDMFAPGPIMQDYYVEGRGRLVDGTSVDPLVDAPGGPIARHVQSFPYTRWTKAMNNIAFGGRTTILPFGRYVCRRWNGTGRPSRALATFELVRHDWAITPLGEPLGEETTHTIWEHRCFD